MSNCESREKMRNTSANKDIGKQNIKASIIFILGS